MSLFLIACPFIILRLTISPFILTFDREALSFFSSAWALSSVAPEVCLASYQTFIIVIGTPWNWAQRLQEAACVLRSSARII
jgi:hypothetical protein